ncbi:hypothetical protein [Ralstonia solanacearum]|uniref:hypothetical protein n=1 Tax=Ralstonia solanacearum TaxID=305 RepID=UPI003AF32AD6
MAVAGLRLRPRDLALYRGVGFEAFGVEPRALCVGGRFYDEAHMVLRLDAGGGAAVPVR